MAGWLAGCQCYVDADFSRDEFETDPNGLFHCHRMSDARNGGCSICNDTKGGNGMEYRSIQFNSMHALLTFRAQRFSRVVVETVSEGVHAREQARACIGSQKGGFLTVHDARHHFVCQARRLQ